MKEEKTMTLKVEKFPLKLSQNIRAYCQDNNTTMREYLIRLIGDGFKLNPKKK